MTVLAENDIEQVVREKLREHGVLGQLDESKSSSLFTPEGVLAEIVFSDASALKEARKAVGEAQRELEGQGVSLLPTVRALWEVDRVEKIETPNPPDVPPELLGALFKGTLKSGEGRHEVWVAVTPSARQVLRPLTSSDQALLEVVRAFLLHQLSISGAGHWNPIREPRQELNESAARYLRWRPYEALKASVDEIFSATVGSSREGIEGFVKLMSYERKSIYNFRDALTDLPGPGGAYAMGERLPTSNHEFYEMLLDDEKRRLEAYYLDQVAKAEKKYPELKAQYPGAFN